MARHLCNKTLTFLTRPSVKTMPSVSRCIRLHSSKAQLIEIDLDSESATAAKTMRKLEDMVRRIIVHKATPVWLPFIPGSSFWVPPPPGSAASKIADLVEKIKNQPTEEESLSVMSLHGWPCSSFFIPSDDSASASPEHVDIGLEFKATGNDFVELDVSFLQFPDKSSKSEDEED